MGDDVIELLLTKPDEMLLKLSAAACRVRKSQHFNTPS